ncbi:hypothetical protein CBQ26_11730 [Deinococcus indicus]|uniref:Uncharacterized protein n=1 Tax=Deinococcus indicus TaxID=223556 RepID=A0A246BJF2_9DEIO|nr:hypothetical protein [Deinococcus indicus]OWL95429.1 hypothetical protein CBQ26_11730 [Deinococcus indicus]
MAKLDVAELMHALRKQAGHDRYRAAFLERARLRAAYPGEQGLPLLGVGSSCGKPAFALPYPLTWTEQNLLALEALARQHRSYVEYGHLAHLRQIATDKELAAVQDWTPFGVVYLRAEYGHAQELLRDLLATLTPQTAPSGQERTTP